MKEKLKLLNRTTILRMFKYPLAFKRTIIILALLSSATSVLSVLNAFLIKLLVDSAVDANRTNFILSLFLVGTVLFGEILIKNVIGYFQTIRIEKETAKFKSEIVAASYKKNWRDIKAFQTGDLLTLINNDSEQILGFWLSTFPGTIALLVHFILAFTLLYNFDPLLALVSFIISPVLLIVGYPIARRLKRYQSNVQESESQLQSYITESIQNIELIKVFGHEDKSIKLLNIFQTNLVDTIKRRSKFTLFSNSFLFLGYSLSHFAGLGLGAYRLYTGRITFGTFSALLDLIGQVQAPLEGLGHSAIDYIISLASSDRINELINLSNETTYDEQKSLDFNFTEDFDQISFVNLSFSYVENSPVIKNLNYEIYRGDKIAIVGPSGCGKTSLSRLLLSFVSPDSGSINVINHQGENIPISPKTRHLFAYVPQENVLFSGTIKDNLLFADEFASDEAMHKALKAACAIEFINELPDGLDTYVGEYGYGLSEGQIQRICIARALLYNKPIIILDEATSALDEATEAKIVDQLGMYNQALTLLAITHRPTIKNICSKSLNL